MKQEPEFFPEHELDLLYLARRLSDALRLESLLTEAGIDYLVETGTYTRGFLMKRELTGAYFYVLPDVLPAARELLRQHRYKPYSA